MTTNVSPIASRVSTLEVVMAQLSEKDRSFASDLVYGKWGFYRTGKLSEKQLHWVKTLTDRATKPTAERTKVDLGDFSPMIALFDTAAKTLKSPGIALHCDGVGEIRINVAGPSARAPGTLNVSTAGGFGSSTWFGRILKDGKFEVSPRQDCPTSLTGLLTAFAADPAKVATEYGKKTGRCTFCSKELTDARSTVVGYGPVCAKRWGLAWG